MDRSFDYSITSNRQLVYKPSLIYERQVDGALSFLPDHDKLRRLRRQGAAWRGKVPSRFKTVTPVTARIRYTSSTVACSPSATSSLPQAPSSIFYGSLVCSLRERNPSRRRLILILYLLTSRWTLTLTFGYLLRTRHHSCESASTPA